MASRIHKRVCYDAEYIRNIECPEKSAHAQSIASLGSVGVVPSSGFVHSCGCVANGLERQMIREFSTGLGSGNRFFLEEIKTRLSRYMFSEHVPAGVCLYVPGHGLVVYYNWVYSQQPMVGSIRDGVFIAPSDGREIEVDFPSFSSGTVFPVPFGESGTATTVGGLMGSTRKLAKVIHGEGYVLNKQDSEGGKGKHVCDVSTYVLHSEIPSIGCLLPCGCIASAKFTEGLRRYLCIRSDEIREGTSIDLDLTSFARVLRRTGAVLHWQPDMGVLCLLSSQVTTLDLDIVFGKKSLTILGQPRESDEVISYSSGSLDSKIQSGYISALPTCRYLQYH